MPELVEIETMINAMHDDLIGRRFLNVNLYREKSLAYSETKTLESLLGKRVKRIERRGKFILMRLDDDYDLTFHMRMSGSLYLADESYPLIKHTHFYALLDNKDTLRFTDPRAFGKIWFTKREDTESVTGISKLGIDPFDPRLNGAYLKERFKNKRTAIKRALIDQSIVAGLGNIYSDEVLYRARISPLRSVKDLSDSELDRLAHLIPQLLSEHILLSKESREELLERGLYEYKNGDSFNVYGKRKGTCPACSTAIERAVFSGRGSYYCPNCQK